MDKKLIVKQPPSSKGRSYEEEEEEGLKPGPAVLFRGRALSEEVIVNNHVRVFNRTQISNPFSPLRVCTKLTEQFLNNMDDWSGPDIGVMLSSRSDLVEREVDSTNHLIAALSKRINPASLTSLIPGYKKGVAEEPKHGGIKSKIGARDYAAAGHISHSYKYVDPRNMEYAVFEYPGAPTLKQGNNFFDNSILNKFPVDSSTFNHGKIKLIKDAFKASEGIDIKDVKILGKNGGLQLICMSKEVIKVIKAPKSSGRKLDYMTDENGVVQMNTLHFIQRPEQLHNILKNIARDVYINPRLENNKLIFKVNEERDITLFIEVNNSDAEKIRNSLVRIAYYKTDRDLKKLNDLNDLNDEFFKIFGETLSSGYHFAIWADDNLPFMVLSGELGYPVSSDVDMLQVPGTFDLPGWVNKNYVTSLGTPELIKNLMSNAASDIKDYDFGGREPSKLAKLFKDNVLAASVFYSSLDNHMFYILGTTSIYDLVIKYAFNKFTTHKLWLHGAESSNPGAEKLDASFSVSKNKFYYSGTDKDYVYFLLHDEDILKQYPLAINASWLSKQYSSCPEMWLDVITIQALQCKISGYEFENYFNYIKENVKCPEWLVGDSMAPLREQAMKEIENIQSITNNYAYSSDDELKKIVSTIYAKHKPGLYSLNEEVIKSCKEENINATTHKRKIG